ncbi:hypothetical protein ATCC90586_011949 [Pythium insidiosum]|nr:hypothetical protein ATCC90586_011949 [Pythium insidiosum]
MSTSPASPSPASPPAEPAPSTPPAPASPVGSAVAAATPPPAESSTPDGSAAPSTPRSPGASDAPVEQRPSPPQATTPTPSASGGSVALTPVDLDRLLSSAAAGDSLSRREYEALAGFARERLTALCDRRVPTDSADSVDSESWSVPFAPTIDATFSEDLAGVDANALVLVPRRPDEPAVGSASTTYSRASSAPPA